MRMGRSGRWKLLGALALAASMAWGDTQTTDDGYT